MQLSLIYIILSLTQITFARENLFKKAESIVEKSERTIQEKAPKEFQKEKRNASVQISTPKGNLDSEILSKGYSAEGTHVILPSNKLGRIYPGLRSGRVLSAIITESLFAFPDGKTPVRARIINDNLQGGVLIGEATLEKNSKRILIEFKRFLPRNSDDEYQLQASALDPKGILGIEGEYKSQEAKFFTAEFLAAAAAGFTDASIERNQNVYGNYVDAPTADTVGKKALTGALSKTAERFAEKVRLSPSYSVLEGPVVIKILVVSQSSNRE